MPPFVNGGHCTPNPSMFSLARSVPGRIRASKGDASKDGFVQDLVAKSSTTQELAEEFDKSFYIDAQGVDLAYGTFDVGQTPVAKLYKDHNGEINNMSKYYAAFDSLFTELLFFDIPNFELEMEKWYAKIAWFWASTPLFGNPYPASKYNIVDAVKVASYYILSWVPLGENRRYLYVAKKEHKELYDFLRRVESRTYAHEYLSMGHKCSSLLAALSSGRVRFPTRVAATAEELDLGIDVNIIQSLAEALVAADFVGNVLLPSVEAGFISKVLFANRTSETDPTSEQVPAKMDIDMLSSDEDYVNTTNTAYADKGGPSVPMEIDIGLSDEEVGFAEKMSQSSDSEDAPPIHATANGEQSVDYKGSAFDLSDPAFIQGMALLYLLAVGGFPSESADNEAAFNIGPNQNITAETLTIVGGVLSRRIRDYYVALIHEFLAVEVDVTIRNQGLVSLIAKQALAVASAYRDVSNKAFSLFLMFHTKNARVMSDTRKALGTNITAPFRRMYLSLIDKESEDYETALKLLGDAIVSGNAHDKVLVKTDPKEKVGNGVGLIIAGLTRYGYDSDKSPETRNGTFKQWQNAATNALADTGKVRLSDSITDLGSAIESGIEKEIVAKTQDVLQEISELYLDQKDVVTYNAFKVFDPVELPISFQPQIEARGAAVEAAYSTAQTDAQATEAFRMHREILTATNDNYGSGHSLARYIAGGRADVSFSKHALVGTAFACARMAVDLQEARERNPSLVTLSQDQFNAARQCAQSIASGVNALSSVAEYVNQPRSGESADKARADLASAIDTYETRNNVLLNIPGMNPFLFTGTLRSGGGRFEFAPVLPDPGAGLYVGPNPIQDHNYYNASRADYYTTVDQVMQITSIEDRHQCLLLGTIQLAAKVVANPSSYNMAQVCDKINNLDVGFKTPFGISVPNTIQLRTVDWLNQQYSELGYDPNATPVDIEYITYQFNRVIYGPLTRTWGPTSAKVPFYPRQLASSYPRESAVSKSSTAQKVLAQTKQMATPGATAVQQEAALQKTVQILERRRIFLEDVKKNPELASRAQLEESAVSRASKASPAIVAGMRAMWHLGGYAKSLVSDIFSAKISTYLLGKDVIVSEPVKPFEVGSAISAAFAYTAGAATATIGNVPALAPISYLMSKSALKASYAEVYLGAATADTVLYTGSELAGRTVDALWNMDAIAVQRDDYFERLASKSATFSMDDIDPEFENADNPVAKPASAPLTKVEIVREARASVEDIASATFEARRLYNAFQIAHKQTSAFMDGTEWTWYAFMRDVLGIQNQKDLQMWLVSGVWKTVWFAVTSALQKTVVAINAEATKLSDKYLDESSFVCALVLYGADLLEHWDVRSYDSLLKGATDAAGWTLALARSVLALLAYCAFHFVSDKARFAGFMRGIQYGSPSNLELAGLGYAWGTLNTVSYSVGAAVGNYVKDNIPSSPWNTVKMIYTVFEDNLFKMIPGIAQNLSARLGTQALSALFSSFFVLRYVRGSIYQHLYNSTQKHQAETAMIAALVEIGANNDIPVTPLIAPRVLDKRELSQLMPKASEPNQERMVRLMKFNVQQSYLRLSRARYQASQSKDERNQPNIRTAADLLQNAQVFYAAFSEIWSNKRIPLSEFIEFSDDIKWTIAAIIWSVDIKDQVSPFDVEGADTMQIFDVVSDGKDDPTAQMQTGLENNLKDPRHYPLVPVLYILANVIDEKDKLTNLLPNVKENNLSASHIGRVFRLTEPPSEIYEAETAAQYLNYIYHKEFQGAPQSISFTQKTAQTKIGQLLKLQTSRFAATIFKQTDKGTFVIDVLSTVYIPLQFARSGLLSISDAINAYRYDAKAEFLVLPEFLVFELPPTSRVTATSTLDMQKHVAWAKESERYDLKAIVFHTGFGLVYYDERWTYISTKPAFETTTSLAVGVQRASSAIRMLVYRRQEPSVALTKDILASRIATINEKFEGMRTQSIVLRPRDKVPESTREVGIANNGNFCFFASVLQVMARRPELRHVFREDFEDALFKNISDESPLEDQRKALQQLSCELSAHSAPGVARDGSCVLMPNLQNQGMGDPGEFFGQMHVYALGALKPEKVEKQYIIGENAEDAAQQVADNWERFYLRQPLLSTDIVSHIMAWNQTLRRCPHGHVTVILQQPSEVITSLPVPASTVGQVTVTDLLRMTEHEPFSENERVFCELCKFDTTYCKSVFRVHVPRISIFNIQENIENQNDRDNLKYTVVPEIELRLATTYDHELGAVVFYVPRHYVSIVKTEDGKWVQYNDRVATYFDNYESAYNAAVSYGFTPKLLFYFSKKTELSIEEQLRALPLEFVRDIGWPLFPDVDVLYAEMLRRQELNQTAAATLRNVLRMEVDEETLTTVQDAADKAAQQLRVISDSHAYYSKFDNTARPRMELELRKMTLGTRNKLARHYFMTGGLIYASTPENISPMLNEKSLIEGLQTSDIGEAVARLLVVYYTDDKIGDGAEEKARHMIQTYGAKAKRAREDDDNDLGRPSKRPVTDLSSILSSGEDDAPSVQERIFATEKARTEAILALQKMDLETYIDELSPEKQSNLARRLGATKKRGIAFSQRIADAAIADPERFAVIAGESDIWKGAYYAYYKRVQSEIDMENKIASASAAALTKAATSDATTAPEGGKTRKRGAEDNDTRTTKRPRRTASPEGTIAALAAMSLK